MRSGRRAVRRATSCVEQECLRYRCVAIEGPVAIGEPDYERDVLRIAAPYLGGRDGRAHAERVGGAASTSRSILVTLQPERWRSEDYGKLRQ